MHEHFGEGKAFEKDKRIIGFYKVPTIFSTIPHNPVIIRNVIFLFFLDYINVSN